jgi:hypothetical protein
MSGQRVFRLEVRMDGAAFDTPFLWFEVARILRHVAADVQATVGGAPALILRDKCGKTCGGAWLSVEPVERLAFKRSARPGRRVTADG